MASDAMDTAKRLHEGKFDLNTVRLDDAPTAEQWFEEINRLKRKLAAAKAVIEFVRQNHNTRSDKFMELIGVYDSAD